MKVVINRCYGGFGLSLKAQKRYAEIKGFELYFYKQTKYSWEGKEEYTKVTDLNGKDLFCYAITKDLGEVTDNLPNDSYFWGHNIERNDSVLIQVIEELGEIVNGDCSKLKIVDIPDGIDWEIDDYDGMERIAEKHRTWG